MEGVSSAIIVPLVYKQKKKNELIIQQKSYCWVTTKLNKLTAFNLVLLLINNTGLFVFFQYYPESIYLRDFLLYNGSIIQAIVYLIVLI